MPVRVSSRKILEQVRAMPKKAKELSSIEVKRLSHAISADGNHYNALHSVGGVAGLLLQVTPSGAKSWVYRYRFGNKRRSMGLGGYPDVTLADARTKAREMKEAISRGEDPVESKRQLKRSIIAEQMATITFDKAAKEYIRMKSKEFRNPRQADQWTTSLATYASPHIGNVPVREIELPHIKAVLDPIWETKTETAKRVQSRMANILGWCAIHGYRAGDNPAQWQGYLDKIYAAPRKVMKRTHLAALPVSDIPLFMKNLKKRSGIAARALEFLILTASRTNEVIGDKRIGKPGITWKELDLKNHVWTIPADRIKAGKEHRVPLGSDALAILEGFPKGGPDDALFPGPGGEIASNNFLTAVLKRMEVDVTVHGFRSTFKDWCRQHTNYADEVSELALAHVNSDATRAAYARDELIDKRRLLMADWAQYCYEGKQPAKVVEMVRA